MIKHIITALKKLTVVIILGTVSNLGFAQNSPNTLGQIKQNQILKLGVMQGEPWYHKNPMTGTWDGIGYRLGVQIAKDLDAKVVPVETTYGNAPAALQSKQVDLVLVLDPTDERKKAVAFASAPLLYYKQGILLRDGINIENWKDLNSSNYRIGTTFGTSIDRDITKRLPDATIERFSNTDETVAAFMSGRIDGVAFFYPALAIAQSKIHMGHLVVPKPVVSIATSGAVRKEDIALREFINDEFKKFMENGTTDKIFKEYLIEKGINPKEIPSVME